MIEDKRTIALPKSLLSKAQKEVVNSEGLYEDVEDYVSHCITFWMRK